MNPTEQTPSESAQLSIGDHCWAWYPDQYDKLELYYCILEKIGSHYCTGVLYTDETFRVKFGRVNDICTPDIELIKPSPDKPSSESSHSPTEQPGDSANNYKCADCGTDINEGEFKTFGICDDCWDRHHKKVQPANNSDEEFKKLVMDTFHELYPYSSGPHLNELFILAERISKYERAKQAELVEENQRLKSQLKDYCNDCQHPTVNERQAAELSKIRQENERYKEALQCMVNVEHHGDFMNAFFDLKDQVKAALQGE